MRKFIINRVVSSLLLIIFIFFSNISALAIHDDLKGGAILHAWCWSFKTIKDHIPDIKAAGYDAVQVSPPQGSYKRKDCPKCKGDCKCLEQNWFYFYQPTNFKIGNLLGTKEEFKEMCEAAEKCGVKVIVDIVANHVAEDLKLVSDDIKGIPNVFHDKKGLPENPNRFEMTQCDLLGLYDLNTGNSNVQEMIKNYMNNCVDCGAWGFRYDAAKHIELPEDKGCGSNFWPNITKNAADKGAKWQYGEVLQDPNGIDVAKFKEYSKYMDVTATEYGKKIRKAITRYGGLDHNDIMHYDSEDVKDDKLVTWVESHDNYANSKKFEGENASFELTDEQIKLGWAIVAGRAAGVPLFFSRPNSNLISKIKAQDPFDKQYYDRIKFDDSLKFDNMGENCALFKDPCIVAINKFRKFMKDEDEYLRNPDNNNNLFIIERGTQNKTKYQGAIIINQSRESKIDSRTKLDVGKYIDILSGKTFIVKENVYDQEKRNGKPVDSGRNGLSGDAEGEIFILVNESDAENLKQLFSQKQQGEYHFK